MVTEEEGEKNDDEDTPITKRELRGVLHNRSEVSDFIRNVDSSFDAETLVELYLPACQLPHFFVKKKSLVLLEVQGSTVSPFWMT